MDESTLFHDPYTDDIGIHVYEDEKHYRPMLSRDSVDDLIPHCPKSEQLAHIKTNFFAFEQIFEEELKNFRCK